MTRHRLLFLIIIIFLAGVGAFVFYYFQGKKSTLPAAINSQSNSADNSFIEGAVQAPAVEGNIVNSGIAGRVVLNSGKPYEASLEIFSAGNLSKPFISIRTHSDGTFQVPLKPGSYVLKPMDPDGPIAPVRNSYPFTVGDGQWLQVRIEYE